MAHPEPAVPLARPRRTVERLAIGSRRPPDETGTALWPRWHRSRVSGVRRDGAAVRWGRRLAPVVVAGIVLVASVSDPSGGPPAPPVFGLPADKLLHGVAYASLAATLGVGLATPVTRDGSDHPGMTCRRILALAVLGATAYGLAMEGLQYPLSYRTFDLLDAAANAVGAMVGTAGWFVGARLRRRLDR